MRASVIINCSKEGLLLKGAIESALRSIECSEFSHECELIVVADSATKLTMSVIGQYASRITTVVETSFGDLGPARNVGVCAAKGDILLFLDGDDLWSSNWIGACWYESQKLPEAIVMHPKYCVCFGGTNQFFVHPDWRDPAFDIRGLILDNYWSALSAVGRRIALENPYPPADYNLGFGYEDWSWNLETSAKGIRHVVVPDTAHFVRIKEIGSMQKSMLGFHTIPSRAFSELLAWDNLNRPHDL